MTKKKINRKISRILAGALTLSTVMMTACGSAQPSADESAEWNEAESGAVISLDITEAETTETAETAETAETETAEAETAEGETEAAETEAATEAADDVTIIEEEAAKLKTISKIPDGFVVAGIDCSGMSGADLAAQINSQVEQAGAQTLTLNLVDASETYTLNDLGLTWANENQIMADIYEGSKGSLISRYKTSKDLSSGELNTTISYSIDEDAVRSVVEDMSSHYNLEPVNSTIKINRGSVTITPSSVGVVADTETAIATVVQDIQNWEGTSITVDIPATVQQPSVTEASFENISLISTYRTDYWSEGTIYSAGRNQNVQQGAANVNGHWFSPGEEMSTLSMIGTVDAEHGFALAGTYNDGTSVPQYGGGLCQVATTLYNAYLQIELEEVYRRPHSNTVSYVPLAMDAMVYPQDNYDFIMRNSTGHMLYIEMYTEGHDVVVNLYGIYDNPSNRTVQYRSVTIYDTPYETQSTEDPSLAPGEVVYDRGGHNACQAQLYKDIYIDGVLSQSILMHTDTYKNMMAIRRYGAAVDGNGTHYFVNDKGYAVSTSGVWYRLNPDGTFLDDPLAGTPEYNWEQWEASQSAEQ